MEMEEFTDALEKVRTIAERIAALEAEGLGKPVDDEDEDYDTAGMSSAAPEGGVSNNRMDSSKRSLTQSASSSSAATPRRLATRGAGMNPGSTAAPIYQLMNYKERPKEEDFVPAARPKPRLRAGEKKNRQSLRDQLGGLSLTPKKLEG